MFDLLLQMSMMVTVQASRHLQTWLFYVCRTDILSLSTHSDSTLYAACQSLTWIPKDSIEFLFIWQRRKPFWHHTVNIVRHCNDLWALWVVVVIWYRYELHEELHS